MNDFYNIPEMRTGKELISDLSVIPEYNSDIRKENQVTRLMALSNLHKLYIPSQMSLEIYNKLYLALVRSIQKKESQISVKQRYENHKAIQQQQYRGIIGGSDSFTIIGTSGIGKSSAIMRTIDLITENKIIEIKNPFTKIIPCLIVQCPFDSSVKGLLLEILMKVDEILGSNYYEKSVKSRVTTDMLIGSVSQVSLNHIGMLIVDEIQNVVNSKNGKSLIGALTQLINNSGISICMVGTPESVPFFRQAMQLARRSVGLEYKNLNYDDYFENFCKVLFSYQYTKNRTAITKSIIEWLFEHSAGVVSIVVSLIYDAQEIAILTGTETLNIETLDKAYTQRLSFLHEYIQPAIVHEKQTNNIRKKKNLRNSNINNDNLNNNKNVYSLSELVKQSKESNKDIVSILKENYTIIEVSI